MSYYYGTERKHSHKKIEKKNLASVTYDATACISLRLYLGRCSAVESVINKEKLFAWKFEKQGIRNKFPSYPFCNTHSRDRNLQ